MTADGAHIGVSPQRALATIIGGAEPPDSSEQMSVEQMREKLLGAPRIDQLAADELVDDDASYDRTCEVTAGEILRWALANPDRFAACAMETEYDWEGDPDHGAEGMKPEFVIKPGLYTVLKDDGIPLADLGLSGFMWGWAYNAAARCLELPPQPNPAFLIVSSDG